MLFTVAAAAGSEIAALPLSEEIAIPLWPAVLKLAVTVPAAFIVTVQVPVPEHVPDQPPKLDPASGVAVSVTCAPRGYCAEHVPPQLMNAGEDATVPAPGPLFVAVNVKN